MDNSLTENIQSNSSLSRVKIIAGYELTRLFNTKRGWMALTAFALIWYFILRYPIYYSTTLVTQPEFANSLKQALGMFGAERLLNWSVPEIAVFWLASLVLYPLFSLFITADQISSDRARGTLRFIVLRCTRTELFFGRYLGQLLILILLVLATIIASTGMAIYRDPSLISSFLPHFGFVLFHMVFVLAPFVAVTALTSVVCQTARSASFLAIIAILGSFILTGVLIYYIPQLDFMMKGLLGAQYPGLVTSFGLQSLNQLVLPICQSVVLLSLALTLFKRKAL